MPATFSVIATCRDTADWVSLSRSAAALKEPVRATSKTTRRPTRVVAAGRRQLEYVFYALRDHHVRALDRALAKDTHRPTTAA
jgi:ribosomal 50S subunit-associated protein YjgA (DUF615 family)